MSPLHSAPDLCSSTAAISFASLVTRRASALRRTTPMSVSRYLNGCCICFFMIQCGADVNQSQRSRANAVHLAIACLACQSGKSKFGINCTAFGPAAATLRMYFASNSSSLKNLSLSVALLNIHVIYSLADVSTLRLLAQRGYQHNALQSHEFYKIACCSHQMTDDV